jgi:hypothetical protein
LVNDGAFVYMRVMIDGLPGDRIARWTKSGGAPTTLAQLGQGYLNLGPVPRRVAVDASHVYYLDAYAIERIGK